MDVHVLLFSPRFCVFEIVHNKKLKRIKWFDTTLNSNVRAKYLPLLNSQNFQHQEESLALKGKIIYECGLNILRTVCI